MLVADRWCPKAKAAGPSGATPNNQSKQLKAGNPRKRDDPSGEAVGRCTTERRMMSTEWASITAFVGGRLDRKWASEAGAAAASCVESSRQCRHKSVLVKSECLLAKSAGPLPKSVDGINEDMSPRDTSLPDLRGAAVPVSPEGSIAWGPNQAQI